MSTNNRIFKKEYAPGFGFRMFWHKSVKLMIAAGNVKRIRADDTMVILTDFRIKSIFIINIEWYNCRMEQAPKL